VFAVEQVNFQQIKQNWRNYMLNDKVQDTLEEKLGAIGCKSGKVEVQWNNIKEFVLDTISDLVGKVKKSSLLSLGLCRK